jgi:hypothetical protein
MTAVLQHELDSYPASGRISVHGVTDGVAGNA